MMEYWNNGILEWWNDAGFKLQVVSCFCNCKLGLESTPFVVLSKPGFETGIGFSFVWWDFVELAKRSGDPQYISLRGRHLRGG